MTPRPTMRRFVTEACDGPFGSALKSDHYSSAGARIIRLGNIGLTRWRDEDCAYIDLDYWRTLERHHARAGDLLVAGLGDENNPVGRACVVPDLGPSMVKADCFRLRLDPRLCDARFLAYYLSYGPGRNHAEALADGSTRKRLTLSKLMAIEMPSLPVRAQRSIADYLDSETARIDAVVSKKRDLVALLEEKRLATLSALVSGSESSARAAQDGDWFPNPPPGWRVTNLGSVTSAIMDGPHVSPRYLDEGDGGVPFISVRNISATAWDLESAKYISRSDFNIFCRRIRPLPGDVLLTKGGSTGIARVVDLDFDFHVWVHVAILKLQPGLVDPDFVAAVLNSRPGYEQSQLGTRGATNQDLALGRIAKIQIPLPPLTEQARIVAAISTIVGRLQDGIDRLGTQIDLLAEHRAALISATVSGEHSVPGVAA